MGARRMRFRGPDDDHRVEVRLDDGELDVRIEVRLDDGELDVRIE